MSSSGPAVWISSVPVHSGSVSRSYGCILEGKLHTVSISHNTVTGERALFVDAEEVPGTSGRTAFLSPPASLSFTLRGRSGAVSIQFDGAAVKYRCTFNGEDVPEENSLVGGSVGRQALEESARMRVEVEGAELGADDRREPLVLYRLRVTRESDGACTVVHRRFRDFVAVNEALRAAYRGSSLLGSLPPLPPRAIKLFGLVDHTTPEFIARRVFLLGDWLHKTIHLPRAGSNPDLLTFLGLVDSVRETSCVFPGASLGLGLRSMPDGGRGVEVSGLAKTAEGGASPAAAYGVRAGDRVSKINGEDTLSDSYELVVAKLKAAPRPVLIHFLGALKRTEGGAGSAAAATPSTAATAAVSTSPLTNAPLGLC